MSSSNPLRDPTDRRLPRIAGPSGLVIFGVTGDLSRKKLMPAVYDLANRGLLPPGFALVGFARREWAHEDFAQVVHDAVKEHARTPFREEVWQQLIQGMRFVQGTFDDDDAFERLRGQLPVGIEMDQVQDQPEAVQRSVGEFVRVLIEALVVVLAVSVVALGLHTRPLRIDMRPGLVVAITIPLVLAITFVVMHYWGIGLHKISLGALIIALGLLVDDAIIAVEMMVRKLEEGYDKARAATFAYELTAMPMLTGTLITAAGEEAYGTCTTKLLVSALMASTLSCDSVPTPTEA